MKSVRTQSTRMGFEPTHAERNWLAVYCLNHSLRLSIDKNLINSGSRSVPKSNGFNPTGRHHYSMFPLLWNHAVMWSCDLSSDYWAACQLWANYWFLWTFFLLAVLPVLSREYFGKSAGSRWSLTVPLWQPVLTVLCATLWPDSVTIHADHRRQAGSSSA